MTWNLRRLRDYLRSAAPDLIVAPTANMAPFDVVANTIVWARAYENQVYVAYANYCRYENWARVLRAELRGSARRVRRGASRA